MNVRHCRVCGEKVRTASLLQGSGLVRTVWPCAQRRVVASGHSQTNGAKRREAALALRPPYTRTEPLSYLACQESGRFDVQVEQERHHCTLLSDEF
jgi:hypothetical protein